MPGAASQSSMHGSISLRTGELAIFGRHFKDFDLAVVPVSPDQLRMYFSSSTEWPLAASPFTPMARETSSIGSGTSSGKA